MTYVRHFQCCRFGNVDCFRAIVLAGTHHSKSHKTTKTYFVWHRKCRRHSQIYIDLCDRSSEKIYASK